MTLRKHGKYDIELRVGDEFFGYMVDRSTDAADVEVAESDQTASIALSSNSPAGDYNWKDQRTMPGVAISDFRAGQGQKVLDRQDSAGNAFRDGRFLDCSEEGEVSIAPGLLTAICTDIEDKIIEAGGIIWAAFDPIVESPPDDTNPETVRWLERYTVTLNHELLIGETDPSFVDDTSIAVNDWLYDPVNREIMQVTAISPAIVVTRAAGFFDNNIDARVEYDHPDTTVLYGYGWRAPDYNIGGDDPPYYHCRALAFDGQFLYAGFSDRSDNGSLWKIDVYAADLSAEEWEPVIAEDATADVHGITDLAYGLGRLYYAVQTATETKAGYIGYDTGGTTLEPNQLTFDAVVGETWNTDHYDDDVRPLITPLVDSKGLKMSGTWCYWLTQSGRNSWLYRMQAPVGFELVKPFAKGFIGTCLESAYDDIFVGGYYLHADGTVEGAVYIVSGDTSERVVTLDNYEMDNSVKGITCVGNLLWITTNTQVFAYNVKTAGWWHVMDLPPSDPDTAIQPVNTGLWDLFQFPDPGPPVLEEPHEAHALDWSVLSTSGTAPSISNVTGTTPDSTLWGGANTRYRRYNFDSVAASDFAAVRVDFAPIDFDSYTGTVPEDGWRMPWKRRTAEISIANTTVEARLRIDAVRSGQWWNPRVCLGRWNAARNRWVFDNWVTPKVVGTWNSFTLSLNGRAALMFHTLDEAFGSEWTETPDFLGEVLVDKLKPSTTEAIWVGAGIPLGEALFQKDGKWVHDEDAGWVSTTNAFRCQLYRINVIAVDLDPVSTAQMPDGTGMAAELDGEIFIPIAGGGGDPGKLAFTRYGETYAGRNAFIETSDSYQGMGTAQKFYRRLEIAYPALLDEQSIDSIPIIDDAPLGSAAPLEATYVGGDAERYSVLSMQAINKGGIKARVYVRMVDEEHLRAADDRLKLNSIGIRFLPNSSALKHVFTVSCIDNVECRDGTLWDFDAGDAIDFLRRLKKSGEVFTLETDAGEFECVMDNYQITYLSKDEHGIGVLQANAQFTVKIIDE